MKCSRVIVIASSIIPLTAPFVLLLLSPLMSSRPHPSHLLTDLSRLVISTPLVLRVGLQFLDLLDVSGLGLLRGKVLLLLPRLALSLVLEREHAWNGGVLEGWVLLGLLEECVDLLWER